MTTVINIKDAPQGWMSDPKYVYIGRERAGRVDPEIPLSRQTVVTGKWGNPIVLRFEKHRQQIYDAYEIWLHKQPASFLREMDRQLWGKILVCFCKPKLCHGDAIVAYVDRNESEYIEGM